MNFSLVLISFFRCPIFGHTLKSNHFHFLVVKPFVAKRLPSSLVLWLIYIFQLIKHFNLLSFACFDAVRFGFVFLAFCCHCCCFSFLFLQRPLRQLFTNCCLELSTFHLHLFGIFISLKYFLDFFLWSTMKWR